MMTLETNAPNQQARPTAAPAGAPVAARAIATSKIYGSGETRVAALDEVSVDIPTGLFTAVMGPSGSGKSTLMHCLAGLDVPTAGKVVIGDTDLSTLNEKQLTHLRRDHVGFIFQAFNLVPTLTAKENIVLPLNLAGRKVDQTWFDQVIGAVGLQGRLDHRPNELSGGQQQRVAVARAMVSRPGIIFADEPTGNLDSVTGGEILSFMRQAVDSFGQTIVMVTHDPNAAAVADRVVFLADGHIVDDMASPTAESILDRLRSLTI